MHIRPAIPSDAPALTAIIDAAYAIYRADGIDLPPVSEGVAEDIASNHVWVAVREGQSSDDASDGHCTDQADGNIIGGLILVLNDDVAKLANIAVHPDAKGLGVGRALLEHCERAAFEAGHHALYLATHKDMPDNVALYQHLGWVETGREDTRVFMKKMLV